MATKEMQQLLTLAVQAGNLKEVIRITSTLNVTSLKSWREGFHCLYNAINSGQIRIAKLLINRGCELYHYSEGKILLNIAVIKGDEEIVQMLLQKGAAISSRDKEGMTALLSLAYRSLVDDQCTRILDLLLAHGLSINGKNRETGYSVLHYAATAGNANIIPLLITRKCYINIRSKKGLTALHVAALNGHFNIVSILLCHGAKHHILTNKGESALCLAVQSGDIKTVEVFVNRVQRSAQSILQERFLIYYAAVARKSPIVELLLLKGAQGINACAPDTGKTALHVACENGDDDIVILLLKKDAHPNVIQESKTDVEKKGKSVGRTALHIAAENEYEGIVNLLLQRNALPGALDEFGRTPLHLATKTGSLPIVATLLRSIDNCLSMFTSAKAGFTPLHIAVENASEDIVKLFLDNGIPVQMPTTMGLTSLHISVQKQDERMTTLLLKYGADVNATGKTAIETPLYIAAEKGNLKIFHILSEASSTRSTKWIEGYFSLCIAAYQGHQKVVKMLLRKGVDPNFHLGNYLIPLHAAAHSGHKQIAELLLEYGAEVNPKNASTSTPLLAAIHAGHEEIIFRLLDRGANVNVRLSLASEMLPSGVQRLLTYGDYSDSEIQGIESKVGFTPLHFAVESFMKNKYHPNLIQALFNHGAKVNVFSETGLTPLALAVNNNLKLVVRCLLAAGADVNIQDSILHTAILKRNEMIVKLLIEAKIDVNAKSRDDSMAIAIAVETNRAKIVRILLEAGADANVDLHGIPILNIALSKKNVEISEMLLKAGVDINAKSKTNKTALSIAVKNDLEVIVRHLIEAGADIHVQWNESPLLNVATFNNNIAIIEMLLNAGVDANQKSDKDLFEPALYVAVSTENHSIVEMILKHGVDVNIKFQNKTALYLAVEKNLTNIVQMLLKAGADVNSKGLNCESVLFIAILKKNRAMVELLLNNNALINFTSSWNPKYVEFRGEYTPLHIAVSYSSVEIVELLLQKGSVIDIELNDFPLHDAVVSGKTAIVEKLLKYGACVNSVCKGGMSPLMHAVKKGSVEIVKLLLSKNANVELKTHAVESLLHFALDIDKNADIIKLLLDCGLDVDATSKNLSAIFRILSYNHLHYDDNTDDEIDEDNDYDVYDGYKLELRYFRTKYWHRGYEELEDDENGWDQSEDDETIDEDDESENSDGSETEDQENKEKSVIESARKNGKTIQNKNEMEEIETSEEETDDEAESEEDEDNNDEDMKLLKLLLSYGANPNAPAKENAERVLHLATRIGKSSAVEMLIQNGAHVNFLDERGNSPFTFAVTRVTFNLNDFEHDRLLEYRKSARLITKEIARLEALNISISEQNQLLIHLEFIKDFYARCQKEVEEMQNKEICSWLKYFDILAENRRKLAIFIKNKKVVEALRSCDYVKLFPLYGEDLKARIREAKKRLILLEKSVKPLKRVLRFNFPSLIVQEIFSHLTTRDLRNLCISCNSSVFLKVEKFDNKL